MRSLSSYKWCLAIVAMVGFSLTAPLASAQNYTTGGTGKKTSGPIFMDSTRQDARAAAGVSSNNPRVSPHNTYSFQRMPAASSFGDLMSNMDRTMAERAAAAAAARNAEYRQRNAETFEQLQQVSDERRQVGYTSGRTRPVSEGSGTAAEDFVRYRYNQQESQTGAPPRVFNLR